MHRRRRHRAHSVWPPCQSSLGWCTWPGVSASPTTSARACPATSRQPAILATSVQSSTAPGPVTPAIRPPPRCCRRRHVSQTAMVTPPVRSEEMMKPHRDHPAGDDITGARPPPKPPPTIQCRRRPAAATRPDYSTGPTDRKTGARHNTPVPLTCQSKLGSIARSLIWPRIGQCAISRPGSGPRSCG